MSKPLVYVEQGRVGLGNMLFPWARGEIFRHKYNLQMLATQWVQLKIGPLLRREKDLRYYTDLFSSRGYVRGPRRWLLLLTAARIAEDQADQAMHNGTAHGLITFRGMEHIFDPLIGHEEMLYRRLLEMVTPRNRQLIEQAPAPHIAIHVRRGDVRTIEKGKAWDRSLSWLGLPEDWYVRAIQRLREWAGWEMPVTIFTDAYEHQIPTLLALPAAQISPKRPAVVDMLVMARAKVLLPTTSSTFSMWSAFLGRMPVLFYPGERLVLHPNPGYNIDTTVDGDITPAAEPLMREILRKF